MKKSDLQRMIRQEVRGLVREEVKREFGRVLPKLIRESIGNVLAREMKRIPRKSVVRKKTATPAGRLEDVMDRSKLADLIGYGDMNPTEAASAPLLEIAGVLMEGGLESKEDAVGQGHLRDYTAESTVFAESSVVQDESVFVDAGGSVPVDVVAALGTHSKKILEATNNKANWRPGMPR